jgi:hypothetical protein
VSVATDVLTEYGINPRVHTVAIAEFAVYNTKNRLRVKYGGLWEAFKDTDIVTYQLNKDKATHMRKEMQELEDVMCKKYGLSRTTFYYIAANLDTDA